MARKRRGEVLVAAVCGLAAFLEVAHLIRGSYDLRLYKQMAAVAAAGGNPYRNTYADFPPVKMAAFTGLQRLGPTAWTTALALVAAALAGLGAAYVYRHGRRPIATLAVVPLVLPSLFFPQWYLSWEDKAVYPAVLIGLLLVVPNETTVRPTVRRAGLIGALAGVLQAYGGGGLLLLPPIIMVIKGRRQRVAVGGGFAATMAVCHIPFFPYWTAGYSHRIARTATGRPGAASLWRIPAALGVYSHLWTPAATLLAVAAVYGLFARGRLDLHGALCLAAAVMLVIGADTGYDRIMAGLLPLLIVAANRWRCTVPALAAVLFVAVTSRGYDPVDLWGVGLCWLPVGLAVAGAFQAVGAGGIGGLPGDGTSAGRTSASRDGKSMVGTTGATAERTITARTAATAAEIAPT